MVSHSLWHNTAYFEGTWESRTFCGSGIAAGTAASGAALWSNFMPSMKTAVCETFKPPYNMYLSCVSLIPQDRERTVIFENTLPLLNIPSSLSPQTGWKLAHISVLGIGKHTAQLKPCLSAPWHLPDMESWPLHLLRGPPPLDTKETSPFLFSTSPFNFDVATAHSPRRICHQQNFSASHL